MAIEFDITLHDEKLQQALDQLQKMLSPGGLRLIFDRWASYVSLLVDIPYPAHTYAPLPKIYDWGDGVLHKFPSLRAQRGFFAALNSGRIRVPYERTGQLAESIEFHLETTQHLARLTVTVPQQGSFDPKWVLGERGEQSYYFRELTNWEPLAETIRTPPLYDDIEDASRIAFETVIDELFVFDDRAGRLRNVQTGQFTGFGAVENLQL